MKNLNDIDLFIFDLDGTIFQSDEANLHAINKALYKLNINVNIDVDDIKTKLIKSSEYFYTKILPPEEVPQWQYIRDKVREEYYSSFSRFGKLYPGVIDTLDILKERGYKFAICSNCSAEYLNVVFSIFKIKKYFNSIECTQKNNIDKPELVKKIISDLGNLKAAVIGDREVDIKAAQKNHILSVGALYGFGYDEAKKADITINQFSELLDVFDGQFPYSE